MSTGARHPSLNRRITAFFDANPDEELTHEMLCQKFGCTLLTARVTIARMRREGFPLESVQVLRMKAKEAV